MSRDSSLRALNALNKTTRFRMKPVLLMFAILIVAAIMIDLRRMSKGDAPVAQVHDVKSDLQNLVLNMDGDRFTDPAGRFSLARPAGWTVETPPASAPYQVIFHGPNGTDISIMATPVEYDSVRDLKKEIDRAEKQSGIATMQDAFYFKDAPAVKRRADLRHSTFLAIDFVKDRVAHHIMFVSPPEYFDQYEPVFMDLLETYEAAGEEETSFSD